MSHLHRRTARRPGIVRKLAKFTVSAAVVAGFAAGAYSTALSVYFNDAPPIGLSSASRAKAATVATSAEKIAIVAPAKAARFTTKDGKSENSAVTAAPQQDKGKRDLAQLLPAPTSAFAADAKLKARFDKVAAQAHEHGRIAAAFGVTQPAEATSNRFADLLSPDARRFAASGQNIGGTMLAYADPSPTAVVGALSAMTSRSQDQAETNDADDGTISDESAVDPWDYDDTPDTMTAPDVRPGRPARPDVAIQKDDGKQPVAEQPKPDRGKVALATPNADGDEGGRGLTNTLKNLFKPAPRASRGVAVYDISAAKVYMPDGSVLEAHSGIGKMADNPNYQHVKMTGPTPAHTYNLRMRESLFHGVEAIRMLPVDGKNKFGRDGFLTHSFLLKGGRAESHGCVAFRDYNKFLNAFKQGKVKQLVVVPGGGKGTFVAKNGDRA